MNHVSFTDSKASGDIRPEPIGRPRRQKTWRVDLGLSLLSCAALPGEKLTNKDIAAWADCSEQIIDMTFHMALTRVKMRLREQMTEEDWDIVNEWFNELGVTLTDEFKENLTF